MSRKSCGSNDSKSATGGRSTKAIAKISASSPPPTSPARPARSYSVQRRSDKQLYALKHIDIRAIDPSERSDLVNEIRLLASLDHPNLMHYYGLWALAGWGERRTGGLFFS